MLHMTCKNPSPNIPDCSSDEDLEQRVEALEECCEEVHTELDTKADAEQINSELESIKAELNALVAGWHYVGDVNNESELPTTITDGEVYYSIDDGGFYVAVGDRYRFISTTPATTEHDGLMSKEDKEKLDNVDTLYKETCGDGEITVTDAEDALLKDLNIELGAPTQAGTPWQDSTKYTDPYLFKACPQIAHEYNREYLDKIVGGTVAWNQILQNSGRFYLFRGTAETNTYDTDTHEQIIKMQGNGNIASYYGFASDNSLTKLIGHVLLFMCDIKCDVQSDALAIAHQTYGTNTQTVTGSYEKFTNMVKVPNSTGSTFFGIKDERSTKGNIYFKNANCFDLTQMFGSTIADYIYSLETANAGAGVAWFKKLFPKPYYEYNEGELISVEGLESHDTVGFNALPLTAESKTVSGVTFTVNSDGTITTNGTATADIYYYLNEHMENHLLPNNRYYIGGCPAGGGSSKYGIEILYSRDPIWWARDVGSGALFTATQSENLRAEIFITNGTNVSGLTFKPCINLSWSGYRNGEYEPYEKHSYPLDNSLTLRGIPKLDSSNNLYYDGDEYASDGSVTRKYGIITFDGSDDENWVLDTRSEGHIYYRFYLRDDSLKKYYDYRGHIINNKGIPTVIGYYDVTTDVGDHVLTAYNVLSNPMNWWYIFSKNEDTVEEFKAWLASNPITVVYELATPTTETAEAYQNVQICDDFGTEEFVSDSIVPVGTETWYGEVYEITKPTKIQIVQNVKKYGVKWDMANAQMTRTLDAEGITTNVTNFKHNGSVNANYSNPFDALYPWRERKLCNIDIDAYRSGSSLKECITHWENDLGFDYNDQYGVWVYTPEFWGRSYIEDGYRYFEIATNALRGYTHYEESIVGRYLGVDITLTIDGASKHCNLPTLGMPMANVSMTNMHTYAQNWGATLNDIYSIDAVSMLYIVEMANMNLQNTLGSGVSSLYLQGVHPSAGSTGNQITLSGLTSAQLSNIIPNAIVDLGTSDGGNQTKRTYITDVSTSGTTTTVTLADSVTVTTATFFSIHGLINVADSEIGSMSGYIGTNSKSNAYYRGQTFYANKFQYILGAYRQQNTGRVWIASKGVTDDYNALDTSVHTDTGLALTQTNGYIKTLGMCEGMGFAPFCTEIGGNATNPVGDYCYVPALSTVNTVLLLGGSAYNGANCGWCGYWNSTAGNSYWDIGSSPRLKTPL